MEKIEEFGWVETINPFSKKVSTVCKICAAELRAEDALSTDTPLPRNKWKNSTCFICDGVSKVKNYMKENPAAPAVDPTPKKKKVKKMTIAQYEAMAKDQFKKFPEIRVSSPIGPCLTQYRMIKENKTTFTVAFWNGGHVSLDKKRKYSVHTKPCSCCEDHPRTAYPNGYMD